MDLLASLVLLAALATAQQPKRDMSNVFPIHLHPKNITWSDITPKNFSEEPRIVGGSEATPHSFPYQVALLVPNTEGIGFCGGSILSAEWILTAAHCVDTRNGTVVAILGAHTITIVENSQQVIYVRDVHIHPSWNTNLLVNDVALLRLESGARLDRSYVSTISLPSAAQSSDTFAGQISTVSGWGKTSDDSDISPVLRFLTATIISNSECRRSFSQVVNSHICVTGDNSVGTCNGDSGGPLVVEDAGGRRTQVGIVSFGSTICEDGHPSVYTRVTSHLQWIHSVSGISAASSPSSGNVLAGLVTAVCALKLQLFR